MVNREEVTAAKRTFGEWFPYHHALRTPRNSLYVGLNTALTRGETSKTELVKLGKKLRIATEYLGEKHVGRVVGDAEKIHDARGWKSAVEHLREHLIPKSPAAVKQDELMERLGIKRTDLEKEIARQITPVFERAHSLGIDLDGLKWTYLALAKGTALDRERVTAATSLVKELLGEVDAPYSKPKIFHGVAQALHAYQQMNGKAATLTDFQRILETHFGTKLRYSDVR